MIDMTDANEDVYELSASTFQQTTKIKPVHKDKGKGKGK
jgi:hypothetical protein